MKQPNYTILEGTELSGQDIKNILGKKTRIIPYPELGSVKSIQQLLPKPNTYFILFFETTNSTTGHWQCVFRSGGGYHFWDSYGLAPSADKKYVSRTILKKLAEYPPYLPNLINKSLQQGDRWNYNKTQYQSWKGSVATCGRHVCTRLLHRSKSEQDYYNYLTQYMKEHDLPNFDAVVASITYEIIRK